jgi:hypothetical protein
MLAPGNGERFRLPQTKPARSDPVEVLHHIQIRDLANSQDMRITIEKDNGIIRLNETFLQDSQSKTLSACRASN